MTQQAESNRALHQFVVEADTYIRKYSPPPFPLLSSEEMAAYLMDELESGFGDAVRDAVLQLQTAENQQETTALLHQLDGIIPDYPTIPKERLYELDQHYLQLSFHAAADSYTATIYDKETLHMQESIQINCPTDKYALPNAIRQFGLEKAQIKTAPAALLQHLRAVHLERKIKYLETMQESVFMPRDTIQSYLENHQKEAAAMSEFQELQQMRDIAKENYQEIYALSGGVIDEVYSSMRLQSELDPNAVTIRQVGDGYLSLVQDVQNAQGEVVGNVEMELELDSQQKTANVVYYKGEDLTVQEVLPGEEGGRTQIALNQKLHDLTQHMKAQEYKPELAFTAALSPQVDPRVFFSPQGQTYQIHVTSIGNQLEIQNRLRSHEDAANTVATVDTHGHVTLHDETVPRLLKSEIEMIARERELNKSHIDLPGFDSGKNPLRTLEDMVEQNDNQLDGMINNVQPEEISPRKEHLEAITERTMPDHLLSAIKKSSVIEKLKNADCEKEIHAPSQMCEMERSM